MYDFPEVISSRALFERPETRDDPFAELVRQVHHDPANAYNIERYLWVLEEPLRRCAVCGELFDPCFAYNGEAAHGHPRRYCSLRCAWRAAERRRRARMTARREVRWGRAA